MLCVRVYSTVELMWGVLVIDRKNGKKKERKKRKKQSFSLADNKILGLDFGSWTFDSNLFQYWQGNIVSPKNSDVPPRRSKLLVRRRYSQKATLISHID